jgi:hypothetical protein
VLGEARDDVVGAGWVRLPVLLGEATVIRKAETEQVKQLPDLSFHWSYCQFFRNVVEQFCMLIDDFRYGIQVVFQLTHV